MKKKLPVVTVAVRDEAARLADLPAEATVALQDLAGTIKDGLMAFCCSAGLAVISQIMEDELTEKAGPKGRHDPDRVATRNGSAPGSVVLGGRTVPVRRPRATRTAGGEVHLDSYAAFGDRDLLSRLAVERMLAGVATRRHALVAEPIGDELEEVARGDSRSAISRRFVAATTEKLAELLASDLSVHDAAVIMIDGIMFHECCCVVALLITADGTKIPVGVWEGDTENGTVVKHLLADLVERGLRFEPGLLLVIDGGKALAAGITRVLGKHAVVQRCSSISAATSLTTSPPSWPGASTASSRRPSTTPTPPEGSRWPKASLPNSNAHTRVPRHRCARASTRCLPCAGSGRRTASPDRCRAPTPSSR